MLSKSHHIDVTDSSVEGVVVRDRPSGTNYIVATTYDTDGRESAYSGVVIKTIQLLIDASDPAIFESQAGYKLLTHAERNSLLADALRPISYVRDV